MASRAAAAGAAGGAAFGAVSASAITMATLGSLGFTSGGVLAGSAAAAIQAIIGNVAAGSVFAAAQSAAATGSVLVGFGVAGTVVLVAAVAVAFSGVAGLVSFGVYKGVQLSYYDDVKKAQSKRLVLELLENWAGKSEEEKVALLASLEPHLVNLKRVWEDLKKVLQEEFEWFEPVIGDGQFFFTKHQGSRDIPNLTNLAKQIRSICRTEKQALVEAAVELLRLWNTLLNIRDTHPNEQERTEAKAQLIIILPIVRASLVLLKRKWSDFKKKLQEKYEWNEPWFGDGTFVQLEEAERFGKDPELPHLAGLLEDIQAICKFDEF